MKFFISFLFIFSALLIAQEEHTWGPERENNWETTYSMAQAIGDNGLYEYVHFVNWEWPNLEIPTEADLLEIRLQFRLSNSSLDQRNLQFSVHKIEEDYWEDVSTENYSYLIRHNDNRLIYTSNNYLSSSNGYVTIDLTISSGEFINFLQSRIESGLNNFTFAFKSEIDGYPFWNIFPMDASINYEKPSIDLTLFYETELQNYIFYNKIGSIESYGDLILNNDLSLPISSGGDRDLSLNSNNTVRTDELPFVVDYPNPGATQKHNKWLVGQTTTNYSLNFDFVANLNTIPGILKAEFLETDEATVKCNLTESTGYVGSFQFKDPWFYYYQNQQWYQENGFQTYNTTLYATNNSLQSYGGIFLNQSGPPNWNTPFYSINAVSPQTKNINGRDHDFYFIEWTSNGKATFANEYAEETGIIFTETGAVVEAQMKGVQLSNNTNGFQNGGQKKYAASFNQGVLNNFYNVYESMGDVWLEYSDDSNNNWDLFREDHLNPYASWSQAKSPSLEIFNDSGTNYIYVVYQERTSSGGYNLILKKFDESAVQKFSEVIYESSNSYSSHDATPVLSISKENSTTKLMVVWKEVNNGTYTDGLYFRGGTDVNHDMVWQSSTPTKITYTGSASLYPTIDSEKDYGSFPYFHLAWQENNAIKYLYLSYPSYISQSGIETVSSGSSFYYHEKPSITVKNTSGIGEPIVVWYVDESAVQMRIRSTSGRWSAFYSYLTADDIGGVNISNNPVDELDYSFVWSEMLGYYNKIVKSSNLTSVSNIGTQGKSVQVAFYSYHVGFEDLAAVNSFSNQYGASLPYAFNTAMLDNTSEKVNAVAMSEGRTGCVIKDDAEFHFTFGDILLDGSKIEFVTIPDTVDVSTTSVLNQYLMTDPFTVASNSSLLYSVIYGVNDSLIAANNLNENEEINFRVELVDDVTNETIGTFDNITQKKSSIIERDNISYQVDLSGLENRTIKLRLVEEDNSVFGYSLAHVYATDTVLTKKNFQQLMWDGKAPVESYALSQNYPNPFNPSTTINYQIPRDGAVKLVIYDALGREVRTLVNEFKTKGRYLAVFNANDLASGVYIYHLKVNDFVQTRKMMLLK